MLKRSKKILLEGTLAEFKNYPRGAEGREYVLMNIEEKKPDGSYAFYEKDEKGDIIPVSYKGTEGYDAAEFILFTDPEFERIILANFNTNPKGGITPKEAEAITDIGQLFKGNTALVTIEDLALLKNVTAIPLTAFLGCTNLLTAIIPKGIANLGNNCFDLCSNLKTVKVYGNASINYYQSLGSVNLDLLECYGSRTLNIGMGSNTLVSSVFISNNTKIISSSTFRNNNSLTEINIPSSIDTIEDLAILNCSNLTSITVDENNTTYDSRNNCNGIIETATNKLIVGCSNTIIPEGITKIGNYAFSGCIGLTSIEIPGSVTEIGSFAFRGCTSLTSIGIPNSVTEIGKDAFSSCSNLLNILFPNNLIYIESGAFMDTAWEQNQPLGMIYIGNILYKYKGTIPTIFTIEEGTTRIAAHIAYYNNIQELVIPASIILILDGAFELCFMLEKVTCKSEEPPAIVSSTFRGSTRATLYVPINSLEAYQTADYWKDFLNIVGFEPEVQP